jgi:hypothetical protein
MPTPALLAAPVRRPLPVLLFLIVMAGLLAACGGSSSTAKTATSATTTAPASTTPTTRAGAGANGFAAYAQCLAQHGVVRSFGGRGSGTTTSTATPPTTVSQATMNAANQACASLRPTGGAGGFGAGAVNSPAAAAYRNCLSLHGVTIPTNGAGTAGGAGAGAGAAAAQNPAFAAAAQACAALRPARPATTTTT